MPALHTAALLALASLLIAGLAGVTWDGDIVWEPVARDTTPTDAEGPRDTPVYSRETLTFPLHGETGEAWLYLPKRPRTSPPPVVLMAHGIGGQKDMGLHPFAEAFVGRGLAALVIDYRTFGGSSGEPRNWASPARHVDDILAAAAWARGPDLAGKVDGTRLALWGSSLAGGHALVAGARLAPPPAAVVAQVPHLSGPAAAKAGMKARGLAGTLRLGRAAVVDVARGVLGLPPVFIKVAGGLSDLAFMQLADEELAAYFAKHPPTYAGGWRNQVRARFALEIGRYSPLKAVPALAAPALLVVAERDSVCPPSLAADAAASAKEGKVSVHTLRGVGHFDVYAGPAFEEAVKAEGEFLVDRLGA